MTAVYDLWREADCESDKQRARRAFDGLPRLSPPVLGGSQ